MWVAVVVIILAVGIGLAVGLKQRSAGNQFMEAGRMIKRDISFVETAEVFTLSETDFKNIVDMIKKADLSDTGVSAESNSEKQIVLFKAKGWAAQLHRLVEEREKCAYCFTFTAWQTYRGMPQNHVQMNLLLTAIEKVFLSIDPNTQVQASRTKTKSKSSFF